MRMASNAIRPAEGSWRSVFLVCALGGLPLSGVWPRLARGHAGGVLEPHEHSRTGHFTRRTLGRLSAARDQLEGQ